jgi:hypothetical protein
MPPDAAIMPRGEIWTGFASPWRTKTDPRFITITGPGKLPRVQATSVPFVAGLDSSAGVATIARGFGELSGGATFARPQDGAMRAIASRAIERALKRPRPVGLTKQ